ncbi:MAG: hypothetical protein ACRDS1_10050 [Pseudonocardiaceae bacterium]
MATSVDEIADDIFRITTHRSDGLPGGLTYNQFLIRGEQPLLMHTGMRCLFPDVLAAVERLIDVRRLRWITGGHASRPDEFGSVNSWLDRAPEAEVVAGTVAVNVCLRHMVDRPARALADGERLDLGDRTVRFHATPHVPFLGGRAALRRGEWHPVLRRPVHHGRRSARGHRRRHCRDGARFRAPDAALHCLSARRPTLRWLAALRPAMLACMHGPAFTGDAPAALRELGAHYDAQFRHVVEAAKA